MWNLYHWSNTSDKINWGRVTHICVGNLTIIGPDNGLSPGRRQAIIWTNAGISLIGPWGTSFSEIFIAIQTFSFKKMHLEMSSAKWRPFRLGLNVITLKDVDNSGLYIFFRSCWKHYTHIILHILCHHTEPIGNELIERALIDAANHVHLFLDVTAPEDGRIIGWKLYAEASGQLTAQVTPVSLQYRNRSVMVCQIIGKSIVCSRACLC